MKKYFVVSDIHGFYDELINELSNNNFDLNNNEHILVICGDAFDRGVNAVRLYKYLKELHSKDRLIYVRGNHEDLLFDCVKELKELDGCASSHHYSNGTVNTVVQFMQEDILDEVLEFIDNVCIDYFEIDKYIFVHGWIPVSYSEESEYNQMFYNPNWRNASKEDWKQARWLNGMKCWSHDIKEDNKIIVCGHFHTGWGHYILHHDGTSQYDCFEPFEDYGIIALDACTVYSHRVNVLVIDESEL